jgi:hypothetical protein
MKKIAIIIIASTLFLCNITDVKAIKKTERKIQKIQIIKQTLIALK